MYKSIDNDVFYQKTQTESLTILDVREVSEFESGHIPDSKLMPLSTLGLAYENLDRDQPYYVICYAGVRSVSACDFLSQAGYDVTNVLGGVALWQGDLV